MFFGEIAAGEIAAGEIAAGEIADGEIADREVAARDLGRQRLKFARTPLGGNPITYPMLFLEENDGSISFLLENVIG